jgi:hypothetical protein
MSNVLDDEFNKKTRVIIDNYFRKDFPLPLISVGYALLGVGVLFLLAGSFLLGPILVIVGGFFSFTFSGVKLDIANKEAQHYTSFYGWKKGNWVGLKSYPFVSILKSRIGFRANNFNAAPMEFSGEELFDIYLLSSDHRERFLIKSEKTEAIAKQSAKELGQKLGVEYANYNPQAPSRKLRR